MEGYDAVAYYDNDIEFQGDVTPVFKCAAAGNFLTTNGGMGEALNVGFFALRPNKKILDAAVEFARTSDYNEITGWGKNGWTPSGGYYVGGECGQGFFHALFYKQTSLIQKALENEKYNFSSYMIDRCIWNYQTSYECLEKLDCSRVRAHHKPMQPGSDPNECLKRQFRKEHIQLNSTFKLLQQKQHNRIETVLNEKAGQKYGFYFPVFNQENGALDVLKNTRQFYPESPIYVLQDGGNLDFGELCKLPKYDCIFDKATPENSRWNPHSWFIRMSKAARILDSEYLIYLEPDVKIIGRHTIEPKHDAGGIYDSFNPKMSDHTKSYLERLGRARDPCFNVKWTHFGLAGGSYLRSAALLDAFSPENVKNIDWEGIKKEEGVDKSVSSDFAMLVALSARGWTVYPWEESAQYFKECVASADATALAAFKKEYPACNLEAAFQHAHKELYRAEVSAEDKALLSQFHDQPADTTCHGCVWFEGADPAKPLPIPSSPPKVDEFFTVSYVPKESELPKKCENPVLVEIDAQGQDHTVGEQQGFFSGDHPDYALLAGKEGLPIATGPRPSWLIKEDELVVDARKQETGGMLIVQPVFMEASKLWGSDQTRPRWLRSILATNRRHAQEHGHAMAIRWLPSTPQLTEWQLKQCGDKSEKECTQSNERENFNWEKHRMLKEYLQSSQNFSHVLMLDADAALVNHNHNVLEKMAEKIEAVKGDVFLTNEDWLKNGENRINGGVILAKNTKWSQDLFEDTTEAHTHGPAGLKQWRIGAKNKQCSSNEQICLNDIMSSFSDAKQHIMLESGISYNRGGCTMKSCYEQISDPTMLVQGMSDPRLEVVHFMGDHSLADKVLCDGKEDYTKDGPAGYGCSK